MTHSSDSDRSRTTVYDLGEALAEVETLWAFRFSQDGISKVKLFFAHIQKLFAGQVEGFHACDTEYHDIFHTVTVFQTTFRLLDGYISAGSIVSEDAAVDLLLAALAHDTGYIRRTGEEEGSGARYTSSHVARSADFVLEHGQKAGWTSVDRMVRFIWATGLKNEYAAQHWQNTQESELAALLGSADIIGQMSDRVYLEKLLFLYREFREAGFPGYETEFDILRKTIDFYDLAIHRLDVDFRGVRSYARLFFRNRQQEDRDFYAEAMDHMMEYLRGILADDSTNFRKKLRRLDLEHVAV
ncbi:MAG: metal-dependent phosphohydrolase [Spirochaetes bacterium]|nr:metal-dependent phosphohydrolase [Spirochaetota bacterium]MBU0956530.1 metal-dependent phosphohydrolase [Spirochaetota bacterium]